MFEPFKAGTYRFIHFLWIVAEAEIFLCMTCSSAGSNMEVATVQQSLVVGHKGPPGIPLAIWLILGTVFLAGMLCQACVPRLCQGGMKMGGQIYDMVCKAYYFIELQVFVPRWKLPTTQKEPQKADKHGTPKHGTPTRTELKPQDYLSLTEMRAPEQERGSSRSSNSIWGPDVTTRKQSESSRMQEAHMRTNPSGGSGRSVLNAMIAAASPRKL